MQNKAFYIAMAFVSLLAIWWLSSSNTDDVSLSESAENDQGSSLTKNATSANTPEVFYSPPAEVKSKPGVSLQSPLATQSEAVDEAPIDSMHESRLPSDDRTPVPEEVVDPELNSEYQAHEEAEIKTDYSETANAPTDLPPAESPEMQNLAQQLQTMRDAGLDETVVREVEEKLIELQRLQDQQTISKSNAEDGNTNFD